MRTRPRAFASAIGSSSDAGQVFPQVQSELTKSFAGAEAVAEQYPKYADQITAAARESFLQGDDWAYTAGLVAILLGAVLVFFCFPRKAREAELLARYHAEDAGQAAQAPSPPVPETARVAR